MTKRPPVLATLAFAAAILAGCATPPADRNQQAGSVIGAVVGGVLGHQVGQGGGRAAATILGAIAGGAIGSAVGRSMDEADRRLAAQALESVPTGSPVHWHNPDTGAAYTVVPTRTYASAQGPCREYQMDAVIGGRNERVYGTACRQEDGSWRAQE